MLEFRWVLPGRRWLLVALLTLPSMAGIFQLVGGVDHLNRRCLAFHLDGQELLLDTGRDWPENRCPARERARLLGLLKGDAGLRRRLRASLAERAVRAPEQATSLLTWKAGHFGLTCVILSGPQGNRCFRPGPGASGLVVDDAYQHLPGLRAQGCHLLRADTGEQVLFKGLSLFYRNDLKATASSLLATVLGDLEAAARLGVVSNLVRVSYFSHELSAEDRAAFPVLARRLGEMGIYLALTPHNYQVGADGEYTSSPAPGQRIPTDYFLPDVWDTWILGELARVLKPWHNVIFGLWNEPANTTWEALETVLRTQAEAVFRSYPAAGPRPLLLVPGIDWCKDFRDARIPLPADSYLVDVHDYPDFWHRDVRYKYQPMIGKVPVLISEMGGILARDYRPQSEADLARIHAILYGLVDAPEQAGAIHYCIWKGDASPDGIREPHGGLSPRGELVREERRAFPTQTDFNR